MHAGDVFHRVEGGSDTGLLRDDTVGVQSVRGAREKTIATKVAANDCPATEAQNVVLHLEEAARGTTVPRPPTQPSGDDGDAGEVVLTLHDARSLASLTIAQVAALLQIPVRSAYVLNQRKKIPGRIRELGRMVRFRATVVVAWIEGETAASGRTSR